MDEIAETHHATALARRLLGRVDALIRARGAHPARTVVLLPYAQLMPLARRLWAGMFADGFAPRFETTMNWAGQAGFVPGPDDLCFDMGRDMLTARALLERAGLERAGLERAGLLNGRADLLAARLVEAAWQLAQVASAVAPAQRPAWVAQARTAVALDVPALALESAIARVALEWAAASAYAGDALLVPGAASAPAAPDLLVIFEGFQAEPLAQALKALHGDRAVSIALDEPAPMGDVRLHEAANAADEAERAAACVLAHIEAGRTPVALAATDRVLTRLIRAMLGARGVALRDETGWKLSTTRAAAHLMAALRACAWDASTDAVLDWIKNAPALAPATVLALERRARRTGAREWRALRLADPVQGSPGGMDAEGKADVQADSAARAQAVDAAEAQAGGSSPLPALMQRIEGWREGLQRARPLTQWLAALRALLQDSGQWRLLEGDAAGDKVLAALRLAEGAGAEFEPLPQAARRLDLASFTAWVGDALEAGSFVPAHPADEQVVILPFHQMLGRPFAAVVLPGCDEQRLPPAPEPPGDWTAAQREALGLPSRAALEAAQRDGWRHALQTPHCDVLWRRGDDSGEPLLPSPLVLQLQLLQTGQAGADPRVPRELPVRPVAHPMPVGHALPLAELSASAYEDLRRCPYRFFALRQLGLQEADELDTEVDKRDFGNWLHAVLSAFHLSQQAQPQPPGPQRLAVIEACADEATRKMGLAPGEFLPFATAWPQVRDGYLQWLDAHEAQGARFSQAESRHEMPLGALRLVGRIDRIDTLADGQALVIDYKTEPLTTTRERVKNPTEDTQLAFYAALLPHDTLQASYVNVGERDGTRGVPQDEVVAARDALVEGILDDMRRIGEGVALPALGEGKVCDFCAARGLCRKDFWV